MAATRSTLALFLTALAAGCLPEPATGPSPFQRTGGSDTGGGDGGVATDATPGGDGSAPDVGDAGQVDGAAPVPDAAPPRERVSRPAECGAAAAASLDERGGQVSVSDGALIDSGLVLGEGALAAAVRVTLDCDADLVREGYVAVGPALRAIAEAPTPLTSPARILLTFSAADVPERIEERHLRLFWKPDRYDLVAEPPLVNPRVDLYDGTVEFDSPGLGSFQIGYREDAGMPVERTYTFRAITGISMGGGATAYLGPKLYEHFDLVVPLGGPTDWPYLMSYILGRVLGGFCTVDDEAGPGAWCGLPEPTVEGEHPSDFRWWFYEDQGGNDFDRSDYVQLLQDISYAYGNPALYNPESPYRPPGMPREELLRSNRDRCFGDPPEPYTIPSGFYDDEYNPDGAYPVIAFCDGEDGDPRGRFDPEAPHDKPTETMLAVDLNNNRRRDPDEPIIRNPWEPYADVGCDGVPSADEPGYDPATNPDPAGDDYDWYRNPDGTEGNRLHDQCGETEEPYDDVGLDGVADTPQFDEGGYDHGEGNGSFDYNPNIARYFERTGGLIFRELPQEARDRLRFWSDAGVRDIFNFAIAHDQLMGHLQAAGQNVQVYDKFERLFGGEVDTITYFPIPQRRDPFGDNGQSVYVRYGNRTPTELDIRQGDGAHVGTAVQAVNRFMSFFDWVHNRWPEGDYEVIQPPFEFEHAVEFFHSERFGKDYRYAVVLPPGYSRPENADKRYPVMLVLHGYGQGPEDLPVTGPILANAMKDGAWQKSIVVFPEGFCGKASVYQCNDGIDNDGDGFLDAANDTEQRRACEADEDCSGGYTCRASATGDRFCCPAEWADCGRPDPECEFDRRRRSEAGEPLSLCSDGVDNDLDGLTDLDDLGCMGEASRDDEADCKKGSFYTTHVAQRDGDAGGPDFEGAILDMLDHIDAHYRTKPPETVTVPR